MKKEIILLFVVIIVLAVLIAAYFIYKPEKNQKTINSQQRLSNSEIQAINLILDGEYKIRAISWKVIDRFGRLPLFLEISQQQNIELTKFVFNKNNLTIPKDNWLINIENFNSTKRACSAGLIQENKNLEIYNEFYPKLKDEDTIYLFNYIKTSLEGNIKEFQKCD